MFGSSVFLCLGVCLVLFGIFGYLISIKLNEQNDKIKNMFDLIYTINNDLQLLRLHSSINPSSQQQQQPSTTQISDSIDIDIGNDSSSSSKCSTNSKGPIDVGVSGGDCSINHNKLVTLPVGGTSKLNVPIKKIVVSDCELSIQDEDNDSDSSDDDLEEDSDSDDDDEPDSDDSELEKYSKNIDIKLISLKKEEPVKGEGNEKDDDKKYIFELSDLEYTIKNTTTDLSSESIPPPPLLQRSHSLFSDIIHNNNNSDINELFQSIGMSGGGMDTFDMDNSEDDDNTNRFMSFTVNSVIDLDNLLPSSDMTETLDTSSPLTTPTKTIVVDLDSLQQQPQNQQDYNKMSIHQLRKIALERNLITSSSKLKKNELLKLF
jgi:hypothetical protein